MRWFILIVVILILAGAFFAAAHFWELPAQWLEEPSFQIFGDIMMIMIALIGLLLSLASLGIFYGVRHELATYVQDQVVRGEELARNWAQYHTHHRVAFSFWRFYEDKRNDIFLDRAVYIEKKAKNYIDIVAKLHQRGWRRKNVTRIEPEEEDVEAQLCLASNNLAFFLAERGKSEDIGRAHELATYIKERAKNYPEREPGFLETYAYVLWKLPKIPKDKQEALKLIKNLLQRSDVSEEEKRIWRHRYGLT